MLWIWRKKKSSHYVIITSLFMFLEQPCPLNTHTVTLGWHTHTNQTVCDKPLKCGYFKHTLTMGRDEIEVPEIPTSVIQTNLNYSERDLLYSSGFTGLLWVCVCVWKQLLHLWGKKKKKKDVFIFFLPSRSNSSSCFDEQHACAAGAGRRCCLSVGEAVCLFLVLSVCLPQSPRLCWHMGEVQTFNFYIKLSLLLL